MDGVLSLPVARILDRSAGCDMNALRRASDATDIAAASASQPNGRRMDACANGSGRAHKL